MFDLSGNTNADQNGRLRPDRYSNETVVSSRANYGHSRVKLTFKLYIWKQWASLLK